jgi:hypothetical protein
LIGLNAGTVFLREAATAGTNVLIMFGGENHFSSKYVSVDEDGLEVSVKL